MKISQILLTPELASKLLGTSPATQRPLTQAKTRKIAEAILRDEWRLTHQPIALDEKGNLIDGQTRCAACVLANRPILVMLAEGVDAASFAVMDIGARRTPGDILHISGVTDARTTAATARLYVGYRDGLLGDAPWRAGGGNVGRLSTITPIRLLRALEESPLLTDSTIRAESAAVASGVGRRGLRSPVQAALIVITEDAKPTAQQYDSFISALTKGADLAPSSPVLTWRQWAVRPITRHPVEVLATLLKVWTIYQRGGRLTQLRAFAEGDSVPSVTAH
jgi:hypothetical protein